MKINRIPTLAILGLAIAHFLAPVAVAGLKPEVQAQVDVRVAEIKLIAADPIIVSAVASQNAHLSSEQAAMTQELWSKFTAQQKLVAALSSNAVAKVLQGRCAAFAEEAFISDARGVKVGFLQKTSNWSHAGKPKHEEPMAGRVWQGNIAVDASTGVNELQVSVPILKDGVPIGSLVVGLNIAKISAQ